MVDYSARELDLVFHALSDSTRRSLLTQLTKKECCVSELAEPHNLTLAGISKHLQVLEKAHFVVKTRDGRSFRCRANLEPLDPVYALLEDLGLYWRSQLDRLEEFLTDNIEKHEKPDASRSKISRSRNPKDHRKKNRSRKG